MEAGDVAWNQGGAFRTQTSRAQDAPGTPFGSLSANEFTHTKVGRPLLSLGVFEAQNSP